MKHLNRLTEYFKEQEEQDVNKTLQTFNCFSKGPVIGTQLLTFNNGQGFKPADGSYIANSESFTSFNGKVYDSKGNEVNFDDLPEWDREL